jgi:hypothetical protein
LGNQLWLFAHFIAFARESGVAVVDPGFTPYARSFEGPSRQLLSHYPPRRSCAGARPLPGGGMLARVAALRATRLGPRGRVWTTVRLSEPAGFGYAHAFDLRAPEFRARAAREHRLIVHGWQFVCGESLSEHRAALTAFLGPVRRVRERVEAAVAAARGEGELLVGVHVRRGDYREFADGRYFFGLELYGDAIAQARALLAPRPVRFVVCSDTPLSPDAFGTDVAAGPGDAVGDLYTLAACDYLIGPPSTFSMWASFYGDVPLFTLESDAPRLRRDGFRVFTSQFMFEPAGQAHP